MTDGDFAVILLHWHESHVLKVCLIIIRFVSFTFVRGSNLVIATKQPKYDIIIGF